MKKAIEKYGWGKSAEVVAWKGESVSAKSGRFICPVCSEYVALDIRGHFRHQTRTAQSIECEERVDGTGISPYEKVGVPIYLKEYDKRFKMYLGFAPIDEHILIKAREKSSYIFIKGKNNIKYNVSEERFASDKNTFVQIDFSPLNDCYKVEYSDDLNEIKKIWTTHSDKWGQGNFFECSESFMRKIKMGGDINISKEYYFIGYVKKLKKYNKFIVLNEYGKIILDGKISIVYKISFKYNSVKKSEFEYLSRYLWESYKINIVEGESRIIPVWPPAVIDGNQILVDEYVKQISVYIDSPNEKPKLFKHADNGYSIETINYERPIIYSVNLLSNRVALSVDKAFGGDIQFINRVRKKEKDIALEVDIVDENGISIIEKEINRISRYKVISNFKGYVVIKSQRQKERMYGIKNENGVIIDNLKWNDEIVIYTNSWNVVLSYRLKRKILCEKEDKIVSKLSRIKGNEVDISPALYAVLRRVNKKTKLYKYLKHVVAKGKIPKKVEKIIISRIGGKNE